MLKKLLLVVCVLSLTPAVSFAENPNDDALRAAEIYQQQYPGRKEPIKYECKVVGVKPSDNLTTFELNPSVSVIDDKGGVSSTFMTAKYYYSFAKHYSLGVEVPFGRFESPDNSTNGLGDLMLSTGIRNTDGIFSYGVILETTFPTGREVLSINKVQLAPAAFMELTFSNHVFLAWGYKHYGSIAGPSDKPDINMGRIRINLAYQAEYDWWVLLDPQYYIDYNNNNQQEFYVEFEMGAMLRDHIAVYFKPGRHFGGNMKSKDWSLSFGVRLHNL